MEKNVPVILPTSKSGPVSALNLSNSGSLLLPGRGEKLVKCGVERAGTYSLLALNFRYMGGVLVGSHK